MAEKQHFPEEEDIFEKALRLLYERRLAQFGIEADIIITKIEDEHKDHHSNPD